MDWLHSVLTDTSRVSHCHPLRLEVPLEVLTLNLRTPHTPSRVREAVDELAALHESGDQDAFRSAMVALSPWRESYLFAKGLSRNAFPLIAVAINSTRTLDAAEAFLSPQQIDGATTTTPPRLLGLFVRVQIRDEDTEDPYDLLSRAAELFSLLDSEHSRFELQAVEIEFDTDSMQDRELTMASQMLARAMLDIKPTPVFKVSVGMIGTKGSLSVWGKMFQIMCRVGADRTTSDEGNELCVSFADRADPRVVTAFWSAAAFSNGFSRLTVRSTDAHVESDRQAQYMALALLSPVSSVTHLDGLFSAFQKSAMDAMWDVQTAGSRDELSRILWKAGSSSDAVVSLSEMDETIARQFGWVLQDSGEHDQIDVFVPGFGQCSVNRDEWHSLTKDVQSSFPHGFQASKLQRIESVLHLSDATTHIQAARFHRLIGASLRFIELKPWGQSCPLDVVVAILESCPYLRDLTIHHLQLAPRPIDVEPTRLVSTTLIKLKLLFVNEPSPAPLSNSFTETFVATVIPIVGQHMEYLEIRKPSGIIPFAHGFDAIARSCVGLFHLKLEHLDIGTLDPLIASYQHGTSRVSSLYLLKSAVESPSLIRFAEFLADRSCPGSTKLGVFHVTHFSETVSDSVQLRGLDAASIKAVLAMLEENRTLTELYLGVTDTGVGRIVPEPLRPFKRRFDIYDEQEIPVASEKVPVEATIALVDALQRNLLPFNHETIRIITTFAAQRIRRSVRYDVVN